MLQINTKKNAKLVEVDGFAYQVRKPGAGESLTLQKSGREVQNLGRVKNLSPTQQTRLEELTMELLGICLNLFEAQDSKGAAYIQTLDVEVLMDVIDQIFGKQTDEAEPEPAAAQAS